eukprot:EG_transcript_6757
MSEHVGEPSRVAFVRSLPPGASEHDLLALARPFGAVTRLLLLTTKNLAFIEFDSVAAASALVDYYHDSPGTLRGHHFYVKFSEKTELTSGTVPSAVPAPTPILPYSPADPAPDGVEEANGRRVLLVTLEGLTQAISVDDVFNVFNYHGRVQRISTFVKNNKNHVLVQFDGPHSATAAMDALNGRDVGVCALTIHWSTLPELTFQRDDDRNRDYTLYTPALPAITPLPPSTVVDSVVSVGRPPAPAPTISLGLLSQLPGLSRLPMTTAIPSPLPVAVGVPITVTSNRPAGQPGAPGSVLFVSNLAEGVAAAALYTLFGLYGPVDLVKVLAKKRDSALVQYPEPQYATQARGFLHGLDLYGQPLNVTTSKNVSILMGAAEEAELVASPATQRPSIYTGKTVAPPSSTLHISNIHPEVTEETLTDLFGQYGPLVAFEFFKTTTKMAKAQFDSVGTATTALLALSFYTIQLGQGKACTLHLAYSKHPVVRPG